MMDKIVVNTAIVGSGASGLAAAITAAERIGGKNVILIEKQAKAGRKLLATGNGRCNISNKNINKSHYFGDEKLISSVLRDFGYNELIRFFRELGLLIREDSDGRLYPYSNQASTVLDCMRNRLIRLGVKEYCSCNINTAEYKNGRILLRNEETEILAENVIFSCGSKASPSLGSDSSGLELLKNAGIRSAPLFPSLSPVESKEKYKALKGVRAKGRVSVICDGNTVRQKQGEIQFNDKGISGICVFECSRLINEYLYFHTVFGKSCRKLYGSIDLMPDYNEKELCSYLRLCRKISDQQPAADILSGALNKRLSEVLVKYCRIDKKLCRDLKESDIMQLSTAVKNFCFTPVNSDSFKTAQVCAGGIGSDEVDPVTLMSRKIKNLYICGEMLNVDGDCGGFNLHFAFGSGIKAAKNIK